MRRAPLGRRPRCRLLKHQVHLLQGKSLGLGDEEIRVHKGTRAQTAPHEEHLRLEVALVHAHHVRRDHRNDRVPEPIRRGRETDSARSHGEGEDFADDDPRAGAPCRGEEEDEDTDEGDLGVDGVDVVRDVFYGVRAGKGVRVVETDGNTDDGADELAGQHAECAPDEERAAAETLNGPEGDGCRADVDECENERDQEGVLDGAGRLEEGGGVVEDEVDTGPLLHHLEGSAEDGATEMALGAFMS